MRVFSLPRKKTWRVHEKMFLPCDAHVGWKQWIGFRAGESSSLVLSPSLYILSPSSKSPSLTIILTNKTLHIPLSIKSIPTLKTNQNLIYSARFPLQASLTWPFIFQSSSGTFCLCFHLEFIIHSLMKLMISRVL